MHCWEYRDLSNHPEQIKYRCVYSRIVTSFLLVRVQKFKKNQSTESCLFRQCNHSYQFLIEKQLEELFIVVILTLRKWQTHLKYALRISLGFLLNKERMSASRRVSILISIHVRIINRVRVYKRWTVYV